MCIIIDNYRFEDVEASLEGFKRDRWFELGLELGLFPNTLEFNKLEYDRNPAKCFRRMLSQWLHGEDNVQKEGGATWVSLVKALKRLKENKIACAIVKKWNVDEVRPL